MSEFMVQTEMRSRSHYIRTVLIAGATLLASVGIADRAAAELDFPQVVTASDADNDGIRNDVDKRIFTPDLADVDQDGIPNDIDRNVYVTDIPDVDYDQLSNGFDQYPYLPFGHAMKDVNRNKCTNLQDLDCDLIPNKQDRFPSTGDPLDADWDGAENGIDKHPYMPFVATSIYDTIIDISYFCNMRTDNDCDGVVNSIDPDDFVAEFPDVDGDDLENLYDPFPYFNPNAVTSISNGATIKDISGKFNLPIVRDIVNGYVSIKNIRQMFDTDSDGDGLNNAVDPYRYTRDWDNDGRDDGFDEEISVNQDKVKEKRQEERRQDKRTEDKRIEEQQAEARQQDKRLAEQRLQDDQERKRQDEKRQRDKIEAERRRNKDN